MFSQVPGGTERFSLTIIYATYDTHVIGNIKSWPRDEKSFSIIEQSRWIKFLLLLLQASIHHPAASATLSHHLRSKEEREEREERDERDERDEKEEEEAA